jgi:hypothetical protein
MLGFLKAEKLAKKGKMSKSSMKSVKRLDDKKMNKKK